MTTLSEEQKVCSRHGGFLAGAERFDGKCFGVSPAEANAMDPQQRLVLELAYEALHGAGARKASLLGDDTGVFLGIERPDWALLQALAPESARKSAFAATGDTTSVAGGRLSFVLGLQGPCVSADTACSSALVALHSGALAIRIGECRSAVASAVGLRLAPQVTLGIAAAGMLSVDGRCKTWDKGANGYVRSEGVGSTVLRAVSDGASGALALSGSAVRQDGRSASLTAPNGSAQRGLLVAAMAVAGLEASAVGGVEAHGTGTALGDPTEAGSMAAAYCAGRESALAVGAAKAGIGHAEAASGMAGLCKVAQQLLRSAVAGNTKLRVLNPLVRERLGAGGAAALPSQPLASAGGACGLSSFGYSGTIAHLLFSAPSQAEPPSRAPVATPFRLVLKQRTYAWGNKLREAAEAGSVGRYGWG